MRRLFESCLWLNQKNKHCHQNAILNFIIDKKCLAKVIKDGTKRPATKQISLMSLGVSKEKSPKPTTAGDKQGNIDIWSTAFKYQWRQACTGRKEPWCTILHQGGSLFLWRNLAQGSAKRHQRKLCIVPSLWWDYRRNQLCHGITWRSATVLLQRIQWKWIILFWK